MTQRVTSICLCKRKWASSVGLSPSPSLGIFVGVVERCVRSLWIFVEGVHEGTSVWKRVLFPTCDTQVPCSSLCFWGVSTLIRVSQIKERHHNTFEKNSVKDDKHTAAAAGHKHQSLHDMRMILTPLSRAESGCTCLSTDLSAVRQQAWKRQERRSH